MHKKRMYTLKMKIILQFEGDQWTDLKTTTLYSRTCQWAAYIFISRVGGEGAGLVPDPMGSKNSLKKPKYFVEKQKGISPVSN